MSQKGSLRGQKPETHSYLLELKGDVAGGQVGWSSLAQERRTQQGSGTTWEQPCMIRCFPAPFPFIELETAWGKVPLDFLGVQGVSDSFPARDLSVQRLLRGAMFRPLRI